MAAVVGNLALLLDLNSHRAVIPDRKSSRSLPIDLILNLHKKEPLLPLPSASIQSKSFESDGDSRRSRLVTRSKANSKVNGVDFDSDEEGNGNGFDDEDEFDEEAAVDWEKGMRMRVKELEQMKELEKAAEELQTRAEEVEGEDREETEEEKRLRVKKELEKVAQEQEERRATAELMFELGQKAYGRGMYGRAIEFLEGALTIIPRPTLFGGEIQIWLAMAYEANNRHKDCIELYRELEKTHPMGSIRRQAKELRYILQAPKLKISQEEMVTIPLIGSSYDSYAGTWTDKNKDKQQNASYTTTNQVPSSRDFIGDFMVWRPPVGLGKSGAFWAALTLWLGLVGAALILQR